MTRVAHDAAAVLDALMNAIAERVVARIGTAVQPTAFRALRDAARSLGWTPRQLREFCERHGVAIAGTRKAPVVDGTALERALESTARVRRKASTARASSMSVSGLGLDDDDLEILARSNVRVASPRTGSTG